MVFSSLPIYFLKSYLLSAYYRLQTVLGAVLLVRDCLNSAMITDQP